MPKPSLTIQHLKTSKQFERNNMIYRYWFEWSDRKNLGAVVLRLELLDAEGKMVTNASVKLPKVKVTGFIPSSEGSPQKPVYDGTVWISIDDIVRDSVPVSFRYWTVEILKKSDVVEGQMAGVFDDISMHG